MQFEICHLQGCLKLSYLTPSCLIFKSFHPLLLIKLVALRKCAANSLTTNVHHHIETSRD